MADKSGIDWTEMSWNPLVGCSHISPGCDGCYAAREAATRLNHLPLYSGLAVRGTDGTYRFTGEVRQAPDRMDAPLRMTKPRRIFVNSVSDLFHKDVHVDFIAGVFAVMAVAHWHTFQVLTKRSQRMRDVLSDPTFRPTVEAKVSELLAAPKTAKRLSSALDQPGWSVDAAKQVTIKWPLPNVVLGVSVENDSYSFRADHLAVTPAATRFVSAEPLLGPLPSLDLYSIDWLIIGGESGPDARPMHPDWVRDLRDRALRMGWLGHVGLCNDHFVEADSFEVWSAKHGHEPFHDRPALFFKQWGEWAPSKTDGGVATNPHLSRHRFQFETDTFSPDGARYDPVGPADQHRPERRMVHMIRVGKKNAGFLLDGDTWREYPGEGGF